MNKTSEKTLEQLEEEKIDRQFKISLGILITVFIIIVTIISIWGYKNYKENKAFEAEMITRAQNSKLK